MEMIARGGLIFSVRGDFFANRHSRLVGLQLLLHVPHHYLNLNHLL